MGYCRGRVSERPLRGGVVRARGGPLSELATSGESARGPLDRYVSTLVDAAARGAEEKLGIDVIALDLRDLVDFYDVLVIASGRNDRQVRSIAEEVERRVDLILGVRPLRVEGISDAQWIAIDYGDVIVHVFDESTRDYYDLEHLWNAARVLRPEPTP